MGQTKKRKKLMTILERKENKRQRRRERKKKRREKKRRKYRDREKIGEGEDKKQETKEWIQLNGELKIVKKNLL